MQSLEKRVTELEKGSREGNGLILIVRRFVMPDQPGAPSGVATFGPHTLRRSSGETEAAFTARVELAAREYFGQKNGIVILTDDGSRCS